MNMRLGNGRLHRIGGLTLALCWSLLGNACGSDEPSSTPSTSARPSTTEPTPTEPEAPEEPPAPAADVRDVSGLEVRLNEDGTVDVEGRDRWGEAIDTQYTTHEYFRNAVPVLERSVTPEQGAGLRALATELAPAGEAPPEDGAESGEGAEPAAGADEAPTERPTRVAPPPPG